MNWLSQHPRWVLVALAALVVGVGHRAVFVRQDNSPETFFGADRPARETYHALRDTFGADEYVLVQLRGARADRPDDLHALARLTRDLSRLPGVSQVLSPTRIYAPDLDTPPRRPSAEQVAAVQKEIEALALYRSLGLVRKEGLGAVAVVVMEGPRARNRLAGDLDSLQRRYRARGHTPLVAGLAPANAAIDRESRRALGMFLPLVVLLSLVVGWVLFRSVRALVALLLPVGGAVLLGVAGLELAGEPLSLVTGVMPPLVLAVGFAGAIHLLTHFGSVEASGLAPDEAARVTIREKWTPTAFAFGTTAIGFGSLALSAVPAVRVLGLAAAGALLAALVLVTLGTPALLLVLRPRLASPAHRQRLLERLALWSLRRRWWLLPAALLLVVGLVFGATRLRPAIDGMELLSEDAPERVAFQRLEAEGVGLGNYELWIRTPVPDDAALLALAPRLERLAAELEGVPHVTATAGPQDLLRMVGLRLAGKPGIPDTLAPLALAPKQTRQEFRKLLGLWVHPQKGLRLTVLTTTPDAESAPRQRTLIRQALRRHFPETPTEVSGHFAMLISTPGTLMDTLVRSLTVTVVLITLAFFVAFRSPVLALGGMAANLMPVLAVLGVMGWLGIKLDVATVMTGSVVYGIAVDDTFHYLYHRHRSGSILRAARIAGQGIVGTTFVVAGGFVVLGLSGFDPVVRFGLLTAFGAGAALGVDALLLPALVGRRFEAGPAG